MVPMTGGLSGGSDRGAVVLRVPAGPGYGRHRRYPICRPQQRVIIMLLLLLGTRLHVVSTGKPRHSLIRLVKRICVSAVPGGWQPVHSAYDTAVVRSEP